MKNYYNVFPNNTIELGSYDPFSQLINLSSLTFVEFENIKKGLDNKVNINNFALFQHELTHWLDHTSTLWGNNNLFLLFNALNARATNSINDFWRIKMYADSVKSDKYFDYFTEIYNPINGSVDNRWSAAQSIGYKFKSNGYTDLERPLLFTRFKTESGVDVARVPITIASILEVIATKVEYETKLSIALSLDDVVTKSILQREYTDELMKLIYNSNLTLYNVIAHLTANSTLQDDIVWTLETASKIGSLVLNLPVSEIKKISIAKSGVPSIDERAEKFMTSGDKGYVFYTLLKNLVTAQGPRFYSIEELLISSGLSDSATIKTKVVNEMRRNINNLIPGPFKTIAEKLMLQGIEIFVNGEVDGRDRIDYASFNIKPRLIFGDTFFEDSSFTIQELLIKLNKQEELNLHEYYDLFEYYESKLDEFIKVCGI